MTRDRASIAAESPLHDYLRQTAAERAAFVMPEVPLPAPEPSRLTQAMLERPDPVTFEEVGMTMERCRQLWAASEERFRRWRLQVPILPQEDV